MKVLFFQTFQPLKQFRKKMKKLKTVNVIFPCGSLRLRRRNQLAGFDEGKLRLPLPASGHLMEDHFGQGAMEPESDDDDKIRLGKAYLQFQEERASRLTAGKHATKTTAQPKEGHDCVGFSQANSRVFGGEKPAAQSKAQTARCPENSGPSSALFWRPWQTCWLWCDLGGWS